MVNKWDGLDEYQKSEVKRKLDVKLSFVSYASIHFISALHGSGVGKLFEPSKGLMSMQVKDIQHHF